MVIDTSALIAILFGEKEAISFIQALSDDSRKLISAFNHLEAAIVVEANKGESGGLKYRSLLRLCISRIFRRALAVQRKRFQSNGYSGCG